MAQLNSQGSIEQLQPSPCCGRPRSLNRTRGSLGVASGFGVEFNLHLTKSLLCLQLQHKRSLLPEAESDAPTKERSDSGDDEVLLNRVATPEAYDDADHGERDYDRQRLSVERVCKSLDD